MQIGQDRVMTITRIQHMTTYLRSLAVEKPQNAAKEKPYYHRKIIVNPVNPAAL